MQNNIAIANQVKIVYPARCGSSQRAALDLIAQKGFISTQDIALEVYSITGNKNYAWRVLREKESSIRMFFRDAAVLNPWLAHEKSIGWHVAGHPVSETEKIRFADVSTIKSSDVANDISDAAIRQAASIAAGLTHKKGDIIGFFLAGKCARSSRDAADAIAAHCAPDQLAASLGVHLSHAEVSPPLIAAIALKHPNEAAKILSVKRPGKNQLVAIERLRVALLSRPVASVAVDKALNGAK